MNPGKRQATQADYQWLFELKKASMGDYIDQVYGWDDAVQEDFFRKDFSPEHVTIITVEGADAGMYVLNIDEEGHFLRRIEVHPSFQNKGVGSAVIRHLIQQAEHEGVPFRLMVFKINPAQRLYNRLGLHIIGETDTHFKMERLPAG